MKLKILRNIPKTIRLSWLRAARGRTKAETAEERVRRITSVPPRKTRICTMVSEVGMPGL
jgi:hypothetical protein